MGCSQLSESVASYLCYLMLTCAHSDDSSHSSSDQRDEDMVIFARGSGAGVNNPFPKKFSTGGPGGSATSSLGRVQGLSEGSAGGPGGRATAAANANGGRFSVDVDTSGSSNVTSIYDGSSSNGSGRSRPTVDADGYDVAAIAAAVAPAPASTQSDAQLDNLQQETAVLQNKLRETEYRRQQMDSHIAELSQRLRDADNTKTTVQSDLAIERQWRQNLVREIDQERAKLDALVTVDAELQETKERYAQLMEEHMQLRANYVQQEQSLVDLGSMVAEEKLRGNELEELKRNEAKQTWVDSSSVADCRACGKEFGLLRRKHHCRRCGQIFCDECKFTHPPTHVRTPTRSHTHTHIYIYITILFISSGMLTSALLLLLSHTHLSCLPFICTSFV